MPKRSLEMTPPSDDGSPSPKKQKSPKSTPKKGYSAAEEAAFNDAVDRICKRYLWQEVKDDPILSARGANGIRSHWDALVKKMRKG